MIYTVTLNPSLDYLVRTDALRPGALCRTREERLYPGGKGVNVSLVCAALGLPTRALGFIAGRTGAMFASLLADTGVEYDFCRLERGMTRINQDNFEAFRQTPGLALACLVDDPVMFKETFDMVVIGPELVRMFDGTLSAAGFSDPREGRAIASSLGIHRLPAVAVFRFGELMGAVEGLKTWAEYEKELVKILMSPVMPKKTISIASA